MWTSVPAHIYPYLSKARLLLKTNGGINEQCLQCVPYMPGTTVQDCSIAGVWNQPQGLQEGLMDALYHDGTRKEGASTPLGRLEAHRSDRKF